MRILYPKDGQKYLYFYDDYDLNPSQNIAKARKLLKEIGCKIGPVWKRDFPEYYICSCDIGEFRLVNDVPAIFLETEESKVIEYLAKELMVVCHDYKKGTEVRLKDGSSAVIKDYIDEDYLIEGIDGTQRLTEKDIVCKKLIPDNVLGEKVHVSLIMQEFGEFSDYVGVVKRVGMSDMNLSITVESVYEGDILEEDEPVILETTIFESEIKSISIFEK